MNKALGLIALTLAAIVFVPAEVSARPVSVDEANANWKASWESGGTTGTTVCAWCEVDPVARPRRPRVTCHWIACDSGGCDQVDVSERKAAPRPLRASTRPR